MNVELHKLNDLWREEFLIIKNELDAVSSNNEALKFSVEYKGNENAFISYFQSTFKGSNVRAATFSTLAENYQDFISIFHDMKKVREMVGSNPDMFENTFIKNLKELLLYQVPNQYTIKYRGTELANHSLGQRASALILFVLGMRENDVIIIDQPEDDIDNQTIYEDVIKLILELKPSVQFIFATHNPNIPVLGDAEQILGCSFETDKITLQSGSIDKKDQQALIVSVMEGGKDAFERRKEIYQTWKA